MRRCLFRGRADRADHARSAVPRQLSRAHPYSASRSLHEYRAVGDCARHMYRPVGRDARYSQASALIRRNIVRQGSDVIQRSFHISNK
jgi:hypothetical protein